MMPLIQAGQIPNCLAAGNRTDSCKTLHTAKQWFFGLLLKELMDGAITISSLTALSHPLRHASLMSSWGTHYCSLVTWTTWSKCASFSSRRSEISVTIFQQRLQHISSTPSFYRDWTTVTASSWASLTASWVSCHRLWTLLLGWYLESGGGGPHKWPLYSGISSTLSGSGSVSSSNDVGWPFMRFSTSPAWSTYRHWCVDRRWWIDAYSFIPASGPFMSPFI